MDKIISLFGNICTVGLAINFDQKRPTTSSRRKGERLPIFQDGEDVSCSASIQVKNGKKLEHNGVKVELVGQINYLADKTAPYEFYTIAKDLEPPGVIIESRQYNWKFKSVDKPYETYEGISVELRYFVRIVILRSYNKNIIEEADFIVQNVSDPPDVNNTIKLEVGIEDCIHIEFEYDKSKYHLNDVIMGKVYFLLVRIPIKSMELEVIRNESSVPGSVESETLTKFEIMDGNPIKLESIPVRLYLSGINVTPTYISIQKKFSVKYFINLVLIDEGDRRYFKKQEVTFWRDRIE